MKKFFIILSICYLFPNQSIAHQIDVKKNDILSLYHNFLHHTEVSFFFIFLHLSIFFYFILIIHKYKISKQNLN